jgi:hypothetical protein
MVEKVLQELPHAKTITTENADINEPMLNINREMGFQPASSDTVWQIPITKVQTYL